jgi:cyclopropane-fatty-acyl-phospholipid synthase
MEFLTKNYSSISTIVDGKVFGRIFTKIQHRLNKNSISGSKKNIEAHYDLGNDFYSMWLDKTMTYSSGFYKEENETIEEAQKSKYQLILDTLDLPVGSSILEIGCGWGGFLEHASNQGYLVKGITISPSQFKFAQDRIENLEIVPDIELIDYRLLEGKFDAVVSIEMFEAVGSEYWDSYFQKIQNILKPNAKAVIQTITMTEDYFEGYDKWPDFIQTYIFPGGELASDKLFIDEARKFDLENIKTTNFSKSYAKTLETWYENFQIAWSDIEEMGFDAKFKRTWDMYLAYCRGGFLNGQLEVSQYLLKIK